HPDWKNGTCELVIALETSDDEWAFAAGVFAERFRGKKSFTYGSFFTTDGPLSREAAMTGFVTFGSPLGEILPSPVDLPTKRVHFKGLYPIYPGEVSLIQAEGFEWFWKHPRYDPLSVSRVDLSARAV